MPELGHEGNLFTKLEIWKNSRREEKPKEIKESVGHRSQEKKVLLKGNGHPCWKRPQRWVKSFHCIWQSEEIIQTQTKTSKLCLVHYFKIRGYLKRKKKDSIFDHGILLRDFSPKVLLHIKTKQNLRTNFYNPGSSFHF